MSDFPQAPPETTAEAIAEAIAETTADASASPEAPSFGWNAYAERTNGRFAMIGFVALLLLELFTRQDFWTWIGL